MDAAYGLLPWHNASARLSAWSTASPLARWRAHHACIARMLLPHHQRRARWRALNVLA